MSKKELLKAKLPDKYEDCSDWFPIGGLDTTPEWIDFLKAGRSKEEYERFCLLHSIENMKRHLVETENEEERILGQRFIDEAIDKYNGVAPAQPI